MARRFLIAGSGPRVGKTTVGCALGFAMRARGPRVGVMKPFDTIESKDGQALALAVGSTLPMDVICPCRGSDRVCPDIGDLSLIRGRFNEIASQSDVVLVEAVRGIDSAHIAALLGLEVILIVGNRRRCVDAMNLRLRSFEVYSLAIAGCILSDYKAGAEPYVDTLDTPPGVPYLGRMRHREPLAKSIVEKLL